MAEKIGTKMWQTSTDRPAKPASDVQDRGKTVPAASSVMSPERKTQRPTGSLTTKPLLNPHTNKLTSARFVVTHDESWEMFGLFENAVLADTAAARSGSPAGQTEKVSQKSVNALYYLLKNKGETATITEMAKSMQISLGWASRLADELVTNGLVTRSRDDRDLRNVRLNPTPEAKAVSGRLWGDRENAIGTALSEIPPENRGLISNFLRRLTEELRRRSHRRGR